jgi:hypothetical protein
MMTLLTDPAMRFSLFATSSQLCRRVVNKPIPTPGAKAKARRAARAGAGFRQDFARQQGRGGEIPRLPDWKTAEMAV